MKTAIRNIVFLAVILGYIFGSSGFTVHHCCCKKHYHVTCAIINAWEHYVFSGCEKEHHNAAIEAISDDDKSNSSIKAAKKHCADFVYTMDGSQYSNEDNLHAPENYLVELFQYLPEDLNSVSNNLYFSVDSGPLLHFDTSHSRYRQWCRPDILCTFLI